MRNGRTVAAVAGAALVAAYALVVTPTGAAFTAATATGGSLSTGTLALSLDDSATALLTVSGMKPQDPVVTRCIAVTNTGSVAASRIGLHAASVSGTGLGGYLNLSVLRGSNGTAYPGCGGFSSSGVVYAGNLSGLPTTTATSVDDGGSGLAAGATRAYQVDVSLQDTAAAANGTVTLSLTWSAR